MPSLAQHGLHVDKVECRMELCAPGPLDAVIRPQHLGAIWSIEGFVWLAAGMGGSEGVVVRRVPVLRHKNVSKPSGHFVNYGDDLVPIRNPKCFD
jgi:hypothetical protein